LVFYNLLQQVYNAEDCCPNQIWNSNKTRMSARDGNSTIKVVAKEAMR
jgi:hypothetical protein